MKVAIGSDHGGFPLKKEVAQLLARDGHQVIDLGAHAYDASDDYPDFALAVARTVVAGQAERGIILCGSGVGASVAANKVRGIQAGLCHDTYSAGQGVRHDDMNVLCMGARVVGVALAEDLVKSFMGATLESHPRFRRRLDKVVAVENDQIARAENC